MYSYFVSKGGSATKHIQKDYKVKTYICQESANQHVAIVGERNDEDHTVPSVMELTGKLTDEEVDEMILETDVDDTQCSEQIVDLPVPQIAERIVELVTALHWSESQNEPWHRSSARRHTQKWWRRSSKILCLQQQVVNAQDAKIVSRQDPSVNQ